ncbi:MAG: radical SAM protein [Theionarchaea archaeon]|nr:radical SAM protein [Theionarchaea archaeon]MBU6999630.1 radical SAM protein [Theionarchaea archaeon]MBU7035316.1 radical SAM protein [Theionarchaea archaeon]MBU7041748.1 radical SAM protein [Theionarchaea archaeon]
MRLALVFPPSMPPTSPPCGIAYLKAYLGTGKAFDLNLDYHSILIDKAQKGELPPVVYCESPEDVREAARFLKDSDAFFDIEEYNRYMATFYDFFNNVYPPLQRACMKYLEGSAGSWMMSFLDELTSPIKRYHPDVVGLSQMVFPQREICMALASYLKHEEYHVILGGASLWHNPEKYLSCKKCDVSEVFDAVFYGEGELALRAYLDEEDLGKIPGIVYKKGAVIRNEKKNLVDLDGIPCPDYSDFLLEQYYTPEIVLPVLTSRGCYWKRCTFCTHHRSYTRYREQSIGKVLSDLKELQHRHGTSHFLLADEMVHPHRYNELSQCIIESGLDIRMYSEAKPTREFTGPLLEAMYAAGVRALLWGVESGTQRILDLMDKGICVHDVEKVLEASHEAGIWNMVFMIIGYPTQTWEESEQDIAFLQRNAPFVSTVTGSEFKLEEGSRMYEAPQDYGIKEAGPGGEFSPVCQYIPEHPLENADLLSKKYEVEFVVLSRGSWYFARMRDHMLLFADRMSKNPLKSQ